MTKIVLASQSAIKKRNPNQDETKDFGDDVVDQHRDLRVERFFPGRVNFGRIIAFQQPDNERTKKMTKEMKK